MADEGMTVSTADGAFHCYVARPSGPGPYPAVVVIQEIFGVNPFVRATADRLAGLGYLAVAPDLFWRIEPGVDLTDKTEAEWKRAFELMGAFDLDKGVEDIAATIAAIRALPESTGKVGAVGYCLGGLLAFLTATRTDADAVVSYYGVNIDKFLGETERLVHPYMLHMAEEDGFVPKDAQARILAGLKNLTNIEVLTYPGRDHAFARDGGQHYDAADAAKANGRTVALFEKALKS